MFDWLRRKDQGPKVIHVKTLKTVRLGHYIEYLPGTERPYHIHRLMQRPDGSKYSEYMGAEYNERMARLAIQKLREFPKFFRDDEDPADMSIGTTPA